VGVTPRTKLAEGGVTVTVLTGASVTVMEDVPVFVSLVAVIVAVPAPTAVTRPFASTVAAETLLEAQVTRRPVSTVPFASLVTAVSCCVGVIPTIRLAVAGVTATVATGIASTVIGVVGAELTNSLVAVTVAVPTLSAVTVVAPLVPEGGLTDKTVGSLDTQLTVRPVSRLPFASLVVAVSCCVPPVIICVVGAATVTDATGARETVMDDVPDFPSLVAVIVVLPTATAVTKPFASTVAAAGLLDDHVTVRPVSTEPFPSLSVAASCCVGATPKTSVAEAGFTVTVATGTGLTVTTGVAALGADSLLAVMIAVPKPVAVTVTVAPPELLTVLAALTVSTAVLLETQVTVRPTSTLPLPSFGVAVSCWV
jgi:hypothetical protein